jgi:hypothetical protein
MKPGIVIPRTGAVATEPNVVLAGAYGREPALATMKLRNERRTTGDISTSLRPQMQELTADC